MLSLFRFSGKQDVSLVQHFDQRVAIEYILVCIWWENGFFILMDYGGGKKK